MLICTSCKRNEAVFTRYYSGEKLCGSCFSRSIEKRVRDTISMYKMLEPNDRISVAVSGGKDSVALLHILTKIEKSFPDATLFTIIVDEGIKGYRNEASKLAIRNCQKLGAEYILTSFKEIYGYEFDEIMRAIRKRDGKGLSPCSYCGVLRRKALNTTAREAGAHKLVTAHSLDDETQTLLINIIHGDPLRIVRSKPMLDSIHPKLVRRVKPFCLMPEKEIAFYAYLKRIEFQSIPCPYATSALRNDLRIMLNGLEEKHAGTKFTIFRSLERIRPAIEAMVKTAKLKECRICGEPTVGELCKPCQLMQSLHIQ